MLWRGVALVGVRTPIRRVSVSTNSPRMKNCAKKWIYSGGAENEGCGKEQKLDSWPRNLRMFSTLWGVLLRSVCEAAGGGVRLAKQEKAIADWQRIRLTSFQLKSFKEIILKIGSIEMHFLWCFKKLSFAWILGRHLCWSCNYGIMMGDNWGISRTSAICMITDPCLKTA